MTMLDDFSAVKLEIYIPVEHLEALQKALAEVGAGQVGNYDQCCAVMDVRGYWRPLEGANPFQGEIGRVETGQECKLEVNCKRERVAETLQAIRAVHPYEEPFINIIPLANHLF